MTEEPSLSTPTKGQQRSKPIGQKTLSETSLFCSEHEGLALLTIFIPLAGIAQHRFLSPNRFIHVLAIHVLGDDTAVVGQILVTLTHGQPYVLEKPI